MADLNKNKNLTRSAKSRRNWSASWKHRVFWDVMSHIWSTMPRLLIKLGKYALYIARAANACSFRKEIDSWTRIDITSCQSRIMWSRRIRPMELDTDRLILHIHSMLRKAQKKKCNTTLEIFQQGSLYRDSLTKIGWDENIMIARDEIEKEDHSENAMRGERSRNENSWRLVLNAEGSNGPVDQSDDCNEAMEICNRLYKERSAIAGCGTTPILPQQQLRQRPNQ